MSRLEPHELRVGNIVAIPDGAKHHSIEPISAYQIYQFTKNKQGSRTPSYYSKMFPVALTREWLNDLGFFEESGNLFIYNFEDVRINMHDSMQNNIVYDLHTNLMDIEIFYDLQSTKDQVGYQITIRHVKYVHQMQNFLFEVLRKDPILMKNNELTFKA